MKNDNLLEIKDLHVSAGEKEILHGVNLTVGKDETHVLMGPNGTGKSTLGYAVTGNPEYTVTSGEIIFDGENITDIPVNARANKGIFLSFQNPLEVPGVTLSAFIRSALEQKTGSRLRLWDFKKKLSETDSGLDVDAVRTVSNGVKLYRERVKGSLLIITHSTRILEALTVDKTHVMENGVIVKNGDASLVGEINENGFGNI